MYHKFDDVTICSYEYPDSKLMSASALITTAVAMHVDTEAMYTACKDVIVEKHIVAVIILIW